MTSSSHLITAFGQFWEREEFVSAIEDGRRRQLLGYRREGRATRLCDFRPSAGVYILWNDHRPTYVGLAAGVGGLFDRLDAHTKDEYKEWSRFSWFSVDPVVESDLRGWGKVERRNDDGPALRVTELVRELEALLIMVLGTNTLAAQRTMKFATGTEWFQVRGADYAPGGIAQRVDPAPLSKRQLTAWE